MKPRNKENREEGKETIESQRLFGFHYMLDTAKNLTPIPSFSYHNNL